MSNILPNAIHRRQLLKISLLSLGFLTAQSQYKANSQSIERVITLTSLTADIVERLDRSTLIGIPTGQLLDEDPRFTGIVRLGLGNAPNLEQLIALQPDWVIGARGFHTDIAERLKGFGIETYLTNVGSWTGLEETIQRLANGISKSPDQLIDQYARLLPSEPPRLRPKTLLLAGTQPILSPKRQSWAGDLLDRFGADNVTAQLQSQGQFRGYVTLSPESILEVDPEIILVVSPESEDPLSGFQSRPFWEQLQAVKNGQVYIFDYYGMVNPGSLDKISATCARLTSLISS
ncbi:MAG: ABC transporter substrate-binding protein [Synechococcaceae cyanobacterium SM2_3_2]|nr:ABC transporter substrate-binding protein [Synechococcaceae cyanobacterium SM2_3_2]